ncbi:MAG: hypothetical protein WBS19_03870 [Candidatus Korobacteraceae bacterium]
MKHISRYIVVLAVFAMALSGVALAQQFAYRVAASVPYDFNIGDQHFAAGNYLFIVNYGDHAVTIQNRATRKSAVALASPVVYASPGYDMRNEGPKVQLDSVGGQYVLSAIQVRDEGVSFPGASSNRSLAKNEGTVTIAAVLR